jgi:hypothetical protein
VKHTVGKDTYEILKNGKPLKNGSEAEAWTAFIPKWVHHIAVATFPASFGKEAEDAIRAVTFAADEGYVDTVIKAVERKWPCSTTKGVKGSQSVKGSQPVKGKKS